MCNLICCVKIVLLACFVVFCVQYWMQNKTYLSDHSEIADIARKHTGTKDRKNAYRRIHKEIKKRFPGHILEEKDTEWLFMNAGGWMGRYWANISDTLLTGSFRQWKEGELESLSSAALMLT